MNETPTPDYGEPWSNQTVDIPGFRTAIIDRHNTARILMSDRLRAIACVNACAGMADPAAEIAAMREVIREAHKIIQVLYMEALDHHKKSWPRANEWIEKHAALATAGA